MSTSSDSGEENDKFREAVDPDFLKNGQFRTHESKNLAKCKMLPVSSRNISNPSSNFNPFDIKATPAFQAHVSKCLRKKLDKVIDDTQELPENNRKKSKKNKGRGIKLLRTSSNFMNVDNDQETPVLSVKKPKKVKMRQQNGNSSSNSCDSDEDRAKEVAVTAEWILSGKATEGWATNTKGKLEVIAVPMSKS